MLPLSRQRSNGSILAIESRRLRLPPVRFRGRDPRTQQAKATRLHCATIDPSANALRTRPNGVTFGIMAESKLPYLLLGIGVGAALGILYAPLAGDELRRDLRQRADEGREFVRRRSGTLREQASSALDKGRGAVNSQRDQLAAALEAGRRAYREATGRDPASDSQGAGA